MEEARTTKHSFLDGCGSCLFRWWAHWRVAALARLWVRASEHPEREANRSQSNAHLPWSLGFLLPSKCFLWVGSSWAAEVCYQWHDIDWLPPGFEDFFVFLLFLGHSHHVASGLWICKMLHDHWGLATARLAHQRTIDSSIPCRHQDIQAFGFPTKKVSLQPRTDWSCDVGQGSDTWWICETLYIKCRQSRSDVEVNIWRYLKLMCRLHRLHPKGRVP